MPTSQTLKDRMLPGDAAQQFTLPSVNSTTTGCGRVRFAHPAEQELARILTFFGVPWTYEPTSFVLREHDNGTIAEMFTPDFYLPEIITYLELTTMRQSLVTRKNRKARMLRERYPNVHLRLIYRRDFMRIMECHRREMQRESATRILRVVQSERSLSTAIDQLALQLVARLHRDRAWNHEPATLMTLNRGSERFANELHIRLAQAGVPSHVARAEIGGSSNANARSLGRVMRRNPRTSLVLVDALVSTGLSLGYAQRWLKRKGIRLASTVALFARAAAQIEGVSLDSVAFDAPNEVLVGFGLQLRPDMSGLPYVGAVRTTSVGPDLFAGTVMLQE